MVVLGMLVLGMIVLRMIVLRMIVLRMGILPVRRVAVGFPMPLVVMLPVLQMQAFGIFKGMFLTTRQGETQQSGRKDEKAQKFHATLFSLTSAALQPPTRPQRHPKKSSRLSGFHRRNDDAAALLLHDPKRTPLRDEFST